MKLTRMTLDSIENLLDTDRVIELGEGSILASRWLPSSLTIN